MLKTVILATSMMVAVPAFAQTAEDTANPETTTAPAAQEATEEPASQEAQIAAVIDREFGTYDANESGALEQIEFATWMTKLRKMSEPTFDANSEAATAWLTSAFDYADSNDDMVVSQEEMVVLLTPKPEPAAAEAAEATAEEPAEEATESAL
jgi:hypothetical protein